MRTAKLAGIAVAAVTLSLLSPAAAMADQPRGQLGYEGQPGNQGGGGGFIGPVPKGLRGYEGQPGNQGG